LISFAGWKSKKEMRVREVPPNVLVSAEPVVEVAEDAAEEGCRSGCKYENALISFSELFMKLWEGCIPSPFIGAEGEGSSPPPPMF
jgi:hypothetical protein